MKFLSFLFFLTASLLPIAAAETQILIQSKFIETTAKEVEKSAVLSERQYENLIRKLSSKKGVDLLTAPSVLARNNQDAKIEIVRKFPYPVRHEEDLDKEFETIDVGVSLAVDAVIKGEDIHLIGRAIVREQDPVPEKSKLPSFKSKAARAKGPFISSFNTTETVFDTVLENGETILLACRQSDRIQGQLLVAITATLVDAAGQPIETAASAPARAGVAKAGKKTPFR